MCGYPQHYCIYCDMVYLKPLYSAEIGRAYLNVGSMRSFGERSKTKHKTIGNHHADL
jgi:hypothetical protein